MLLTTIIPALITNEQSEYLLNLTLSKIPTHSKIILVTQNKKPILKHIKRFKVINWLHFDKPIGKWNAIREGQNILRKNEPGDGRIVLLDADDPIQYDSLIASYDFCKSMKEDWLIGCRHKIILYADDQLSKRSRFYIEVFTNSLLLLQLLSKNKLSQLKAPDIQSGFYIFKSNVFKNINLSYDIDYGGELLLFYQLITNKYNFCNFDIEITKLRPSNYNIQQILTEIFKLYCFKNIKLNHIKEAIKLAPILYNRYFCNGEYLQFKKEVFFMLKNCQINRKNNKKYKT